MRSTRDENHNLNKLRLIPASGLFKLVMANILCQSPETISGNQHVVGLTDQYTNLIKTVLVSTVTSKNAPTVSVDT